ncbi:hypothetical protein [Halorhabdus sp. CUG00001]|uniref:hypothetical protein n=1 Tax=Halorhabdus sp. CUG00001 TaxID=2600297 RepID=UPI00131CFCBE|nr:hypothetical protein [Halorhabdus sp. CUG00001]
MTERVDSQMDGESVSRRAVLGGVAVGGSALLAGCSGVSGMFSDSDGGDQSDRPEAQLFPVATDAADDACQPASGESKSATGPGAAEWFAYGGCGSYKTYSVVPEETYWILSRTDSALLTDGSYEIHEQVGTSWESQQTVSGPQGEQKERMSKYVPATEQFRIVNVGAGFYVEVYGPNPSSTV